MPKTILIVLLVGAAAWGCATTRTEVGPSKLKEIEGVWATLPIRPGMVEVNGSVSSDGGRVWIEKTYRSDASFDDVKRFYTETLARDGWRFTGERELKDRGRFRGERLLEFHKNAFELDVQSAGARKADLGWDYQIDLTSP